MKLVINNPRCILTTNLNKITLVFNFSTMESIIHTQSNVSLAVYTLFCCLCSVTQLCLTLCDLMDCSIPGFPVLHYFQEFSQTHVH